MEVLEVLSIIAKISRYLLVHNNTYKKTQLHFIKISKQINQVHEMSQILQTRIMLIAKSLKGLRKLSHFPHFHAKGIQ